MAISVMKRVVFIAERDNRDLLLESLQEMKGTQVVPFEDVNDFDDDLFTIGSSSEHSELINYYYHKTREILDFYAGYAPKVPLLTKLRKKRDTLTLSELDEAVDSNKVVRQVNYIEKQRDRMAQLDNELNELREEEQFLRKWGSLSFDPNVLDELKYFNVVVGSIDNEDANEFIDNLTRAVFEDVIINELFISDDDNGYMIVYANDQEAKVNEIIRTSDFQEINYSFRGLPKDVLAANLKHRDQLLEEQKNIKKGLKENITMVENLQLAHEYYGNLIERHKAGKFIMDSDHLFVLQGWMEEHKVTDTIANVTEHLGEDSFAYFTYDVQDDEIDEVPTTLKNNALNAPFETLTLQYGVPKYDSMDPTPWYSLFHILFFGIMSADLGYGLLLFLGTLIPIVFFDLSAGMKKNLKMFNFMSIGTMLVGLFFGSFFGYSLPFHVMDLTAQVIEVMVISVILGVIHMLLGYAIKVYLAAKTKEYASMYLDAIQWMLILIGASIMAANIGLGINSDFLNNAGLFLILANIVGMFIVNMIDSGNPFIGFGKGLFGLIDLAGLVGDIVSYTRLTALAVAGANIGMAFNLIVGLLPPIVRFTVGILLFLALHGLNIFITYLGAYVHSMRLEFVEFFGKFFESGGRAFKPLRPMEKFVWIKNQLEK